MERPCRSCGAGGLELVLSLGDVPLANALRTHEQLGLPERRYPLDLVYCARCSLAQITASTPPEELFDEYAYFSSNSDAFVAHAKGIAERMARQRRLGPSSLVVEVASNDGYLLQHYVAAGVPVLGIDPARNVAEVAERRGVPTMCRYFGTDVAAELRSQGRLADVVHANNVIAHVPDLDGFVRGIELVLAEGGVAVIETPYVRDLVDRVEFDTIYHEHLYYWSLTALDEVLRRNGLAALAVEHIPVHGGSLRIVAGRRRGARPETTVTDLLAEEERVGLTSPGYYRGFADRVDTLRKCLTRMLGDLKARGRHLAGYGAAAKATVLLNAFEIGSETLDYVADRSPYKQGRYLPGVALPIVPPERLLEDMPDAVLLLAWNFADEVLAQQHRYVAAGGRFILPGPTPRLVP